MNKEMNLPCSIPKIINHNVKVTWLKDGNEISISRWNSPKNLDGDYSISLDENSEIPQGDYLCSISFPDLEDKVQIMHKVYKMPVIISKPNTVQLENYEPTCVKYPFLTWKIKYKSCTKCTKC